MDAGKKVLLDLFAGSLRFTVPVYQRRYSWGEAQCRQLWTDIVTAGRHPDRTHFTGSVVWMQDGGIRPDGRSLCLLIDGQQRLASVSLLLIALAEHARRHPDGLCFSADMIVDRGYLVDKYSDGDARYKLTLSGDDRVVLRNLTDRLVDPGRPVSGGADSNLERNLDLFRGWVGAIGDANVVWNGLQRLEVVSVTLDQGRDEPQLVFESMNSTGLDLETSDLVRNYMLMGCPVDEQAALYGDYWQPMERRLRGLSFDAFLHDWMVATLARPVPRGRAMYSEFKRHAADSSCRAWTASAGCCRPCWSIRSLTRRSGERKASATPWSAIGWALCGILTPLSRTRWSCVCSRCGGMAAWTVTVCCACSGTLNRICSAAWYARSAATA